MNTANIMNIPQNTSLSKYTNRQKEMLRTYIKNPDNYDRLIGGNIRKLRTEHNMSIDELAERLDLSNAMTGLMERGQRGTKLEHLLNLCIIFDCTMEHILFRGTLPDKKIRPADAVHSLMTGLSDTDAEFISSIIRVFKRYSLQKKKELIKEDRRSKAKHHGKRIKRRYHIGKRVRPSK